jgi:uncharacterized membrane protein
LLKFLPAYLTIIVVMFVLDIIWLSMIAQPLYQQGIGHLMADEPNFLFAGMFYLVYAAGLIWFALMPNRHHRGLKNTFATAAAFGFFVYASYDLTNLALLKDWSLGLSVIDVTWGTLLSGVSAAFGKWVFNRMNRIY